ncbi:MAG: hypothetical protein AB7V22_01855 [Kiritimatiellia bacterium]
MKRFTVLLIAALILFGVLPNSFGSHMSGTQDVNFTYLSYSYWAFIHDYTTGLRESNTPGFIAYDSELVYENQYGGVHVAYVYLPAIGAYTSAQALRHVSLRFFLYPLPLLPI